MEDSINYNDKLLERTFTITPDAVNINRLSDGLYISVNEGFTNLTGFTREETIGRTSVEMAIWYDPEDRKKLIDNLRSDRKVASMEMKFRMKNGDLRTGLMSAEIIDLNGVPHILSLTRDITYRKQIETALDESEARYRELVDLAPDGIMFGFKNGLITGANSRMIRITGRTLDELIGSHVSILFSAEELKEFPLQFDRVNAGELVMVERNILLPDGSTLPVEMHTKMMPDGSYQMICHDISGRRKSEKELKKLSRAVEQSPTSIVITDPDGTIEYVNTKLCEITGYTREELIGQNPRIWSSHEKSAEEYAEFWRIIKSEKEWKGEFHNRKKNGELFWESATISSITNEKNQIIHFLGIKEDITQKKLLEEKTIASEKRYRELFLANPIPSFIIYEDTLEFIEVNDAAIVKYGYSKEEFSSMTLKDIRRPEDLPHLMEIVKEFRNEEFHTAITRHMRKDETVFPADITSHSLPEKNGRRPRLVMVLDITERVKAAEQMILAKEKAEASDRLKTIFLNNISHEVRTPLNGIIGFTELFTQRTLSDREKDDAVSMLVESSDRLLNTITNYMDISLLTSGSLTVNSKEIFPARIMRLLHDHYEFISVKKNLKLFLEMPGQAENISLISDEEILHKIMSHLLDNAVKFIERGEIHFGFKKNDSLLEFFVRDTGSGISKESLNTIFERFFKGELRQVRQFEGSGLGLPIAKGMIEILGGEIKVESQLGIGSTFSFIIPMNQKSDKKFDVSDRNEKIKGKQDDDKFIILVAEDDETNFFYLNALLKIETNATVLHASNGREAVQLFKENPDIGLILMDVKMPDIDGLEATRQIKQINQDVPIIAITAYAMSGDRERVLAAGCDDYLSKPINKKNLLKKMEELYKV